jgi:hypothetical protein
MGRSLASIRSSQPQRPANSNQRFYLTVLTTVLRYQQVLLYLRVA